MYTITFDDKKEKFVMGEHESSEVGDLFILIAKENDYEEVSRACSESHALHMLRCNGIEIDLQFEF